MAFNLDEKETGVILLGESTDLFAGSEAQNISAYIPTNLTSITDGQIYLSPDLFQKGNLPAVDVGKSVSRVGGKTQLAAYRSQYDPLAVARQIAALVAVNQGVFDPIALEGVPEAEKKVQHAVAQQLPDLCERIERNVNLTQADIEALVRVAREALEGKSGA